MTTFVKAEPTISNVYCVIKSTMKQGHIPLKKDGRHSDCFVFVINGTTRYDFEDYNVTVNTGGIMYLAKDSVYSMDIISDEYEVIFVDFDFDYRNCQRLKSEFFPKVQTQLPDMFENLLDTWIEKKTGYRSRCMSILYGIMFALLSEQNHAYHPSSRYDLIRHSVDYLKENYHRPNISVEDAAMCSEISSVHFRRIFKELYSISPIKYVNTLRIDRAKELLKYDNTNSVSQIAELCGYSDVYYFSKIFKSHTGMTPTVYRKKHHI